MSKEDKAFQNLSDQYDALTQSIMIARKRLRECADKKELAERTYALAKKSKVIAERDFAAGRLSGKIFEDKKNRFVVTQKRLLEINRHNRSLVKSIEDEMARLMARQIAMKTTLNNARINLICHHVKKESARIRNKFSAELVRVYALHQLTGTHQNFSSFMTEIFGDNNVIHNELQKHYPELIAVFGEEK